MKKTWAKSGKHEKHAKRTSALFLAPSFLGVMAFFILPFIVIWNLTDWVILSE